MATSPPPRRSHEESVDDHHQDGIQNPPYRRWPYEVTKDRRRVSQEPDPMSGRRNSHPDNHDHDERPTLKPPKHREYTEETKFDHQHGRSSAATYFQPSDLDNREKQQRFEDLKGWNDGTRDSDRQSWEGEADKSLWAESYGQRLELSRFAIQTAKSLLADLGDIRQLGYFNSLHTAVLAALTEGYQRHWHHLRCRCNPYEGQRTWRNRTDFRTLWTELGLDEAELSSAVSLLGKKTNV